MRKADLGRNLLLAATAAALVGLAAFAFASGSAGFAESAAAQATAGLRFQPRRSRSRSGRRVAATGLSP